MSKICYKSAMDPIPFDDFLKRTGFSIDDFGLYNCDKISHIVAPTDLKKVLMVAYMTENYLHKLLSKVGTLGKPDNKLYANAKICVEDINPKSFFLGQKFIYRKNREAILDNLQNLFIDLPVQEEIARLSPYLIIGQNENNQYVLAQYLPPIIEIHGDKLVLLDGIHRSSIVKAVNSTLRCIVIKDVKVPFPCMVKPWSEIKVVDEKPPKIEDRYFDLKVELFRDLKGIGVDG